MAQGRHGEALSACIGVASVVPEGWEVHLLMGEAKAASGAFEDARSDFELVLRLEPGCAPSSRGLARAVAALEGNEAAVPYWRRAADQLEYWGSDDTILPNGQSGPLNQPLSRAGLAHRLLRGELWEHAVKESRACLANEPGRIDLVVVLIRSLWRSHQMEEARVGLAALRSRQPLALPANLLAALDAQVNGGDSSQYLALARRVDPSLRGAFRVLDDDEVALLVPSEEIPLDVEPPPAFASAKMIDLPGTVISADDPIAGSMPTDDEGDSVAVAQDSSADKRHQPVTGISLRGQNPAVSKPDHLMARDDDLAPADASSDRVQSEDTEAAGPLEMPRTPDAWRAVGNERRRQGDFAGAIKAYAEALVQLRSR